MNTIVVGNGFIASHLPYKKTNDRLSIDNIKGFIDKYKPDVIVNCIGFCGRPNIDQCESEKSKTYMSNVVLPLALANECHKYGIHLVHIGSGCIFFGESPNIMYEGATDDLAIRCDLGWMETDFANPKSYYSKTKYACDLVLGQMDNVSTLRIRMPISTQNNPRNFINKVRGYSKVIDVPNSMTFVDDLVKVVDWCINNSKTGLYHVVNPGPLSAADVMKEFQKYVPEHKFEAINEAELDTLTKAKRSNCLLNADKLKNEGFEMTPSSQALKNCMAEYIKNI